MKVAKEAEQPSRISSVQEFFSDIQGKTMWRITAGGIEFTCDSDPKVRVGQYVIVSVSFTVVPAPTSGSEP